MGESTIDTEIRKKGLNVLFKNLGEVDTIRFLSQVTTEKRDYMKLQNEMFNGMSVKEIYKKANDYYEKKTQEKYSHSGTPREQV